MEESAVQQEKLEGSREGGPDGGKAGWKEECSLSSLLKHSCLFCWSSSRDAELVDTDDRVVAKAAEIRELEHAVAVENLELQEQQSDRNELEETLVKLEDQKEKLVQQIKTTRQLCYEESQQILSLQAEEVQKESQVEEYERELARARWRLKKLREEVKHAKKKVEEAGERNTPLQDSIRQSYEDILQEEHTLCSLSGGAVTPESQLEESTSPADTTEDDPLPMRPWGRSQSLPAYADLILDANASSFCNNLAGTREEDDSGTSSTKMDRSDIDDDPEEEDLHEERDQEVDPEGPAFNPDPVNQLDFYQADPFAHVQSDHDLFNEDLFPKTDSSGGFASDPFKGSDPFAADMLFPRAGEGAENAADEADTSLSCAENKASTGTQCFESEFPDEDSDIEISYSREDLDAMVVADDPHGFKPIQSSSEELGPEPVQGWRSQGQYSVESDPNGYELDLGAISLPSDIEEHSLGSIAGEAAVVATAQLQQGLSLSPAEPAPLVDEESGTVGSMQAADWASDSEDEAGNPATPQNSLDVSVQPSFELNYEPGSQSSFDPYGFKLSPEHSSHTLLDPDEAELSPELPENELTFDPEPSCAQLEQLSFDHYDFDISSSPMVRDSDPYGFKLSPEEENQEVLDLCDNREEVEPSHCSNQEVLEPHPFENQEVLEHDNQELLDVFNNGNQEVLEASSLDRREQVLHENQELLDIFGHDNQEVVEPFCDLSNEEHFEPPDFDNQEVLEPCSNQEVLHLTCPENQEVLDLDSQGNQELLELGGKENQEVLIASSHGNQTIEHRSSNENQQLLDFGSRDNKEVLDSFSMEVLPKSNNNKQCSVDAQPVSWSSSSDSDVASEDLLGLELANTSICAATNLPARQQVAEGDLGSVFGAGGYVGCPDVTDDLEPMEPRRVAAAEPARPVRPPRPSLRAKEQSQAQSQAQTQSQAQAQAQSQSQGIDLK